MYAPPSGSPLDFELQRGRAFEGAEIRSVCAMTSAISVLQRGRAFEGAEIAPTLEATKAERFHRLCERFCFRELPMG